MPNARPISVLAIASSPVQKGNWKEAIIEILLSFLSTTDSLTTVGQDKCFSISQAPSVAFWLEDFPNSFSSKDFQNFAQLHPLCIQVIITGPWDSGRSRSDGQSDQFHYIRWTQLPYQWIAYQKQFRQGLKTIWDQPTSLSRAQRFQNTSNITKPVSDDLTLCPESVSEMNFLILSGDKVFQDTLRESLQAFFPHTKTADSITPNNQSDWNSAISAWAENLGKVSQPPVVIIDTTMQTLLEILEGGILNNENIEGKSQSSDDSSSSTPKLRWISLVSFAEIQMSPTLFTKSFLSGSQYRILGKPFHNIELQSAITDLCF